MVSGSSEGWWHKGGHCVDGMRVVVLQSAVGLNRMAPLAGSSRAGPQGMNGLAAGIRDACGNERLAEEETREGTVMLCQA